MGPWKPIERINSSSWEVFAIIDHSIQAKRFKVPIYKNIFLQKIDPEHINNICLIAKRHTKKYCRAFNYSKKIFILLLYLGKFKKYSVKQRVSPIRFTITIFAITSYV